MNLSDLQQEFTQCLTLLMQKLNSDGVGFTLGEAYRSQEQAEINALTGLQRKTVESLLVTQFPELAAAIGGSTSAGIRNSVHRLRLAIDLNLFQNGTFVTDPALYRTYGDWWKQQNPNACYGGDWGDGDHFSFEYQGVK